MALNHAPTISGGQSRITGLATLVAASRASNADIFARHERVFLSFSGGKDSLAILHLCEPYRDRLSLVWVNTRGHGSATRT